MIIGEHKYLSVTPKALKEICARSGFGSWAHKGNNSDGRSTDFRPGVYHRGRRDREASAISKLERTLGLSCQDRTVCLGMKIRSLSMATTLGLPFLGG